MPGAGRRAGSERAFRALISDLDVVAAIDSGGKALEVIPGQKNYK
jgi:hypothetical protein